MRVKGVDKFLKLRKSLLERGVDLNPPATNTALQQFSNNLGVRMPEEFIELYQNFDGFKNLDTKSMFELWSIDRITSEAVEFVTTIGPAKYFPVGDFMIFSDVLVLRERRDDHGPTLLFLYEQTEPAPTLFDFLQDLAHGLNDLSSNRVKPC